ncbi:hypothetical protein NYE54_09200 [Paenibacillus sp. FSL K6-1330]|uniref:hypothetical protein n=1 Tax=Paenibacillus sp. FSL K6-1330 TaxID=2975292 RepID=UPI0030DA2619
MRKKAIFAILGLALATTPMTAFASSNEAVLEPTSTIKPSLFDNTIVTPFQIDQEFSINFNGGSNVQRQFTINPGYGHLKVFFMNNSSYPVTVSIVHKSSGLIYLNRDIPKNDTLDWRSFNEGYPQGMRTGEYDVTYKGNSNDVNGVAYFKMGSSLGDF